MADVPPLWLVVRRATVPVVPMKALICSWLGHKWDKDWRAIDTKTTFFRRVDCLRCGRAIDGAALKRISEVNPRLTRDL